MEPINKRIFFVVVLVTMLIGSVSVLYFSLATFSNEIPRQSFMQTTDNGIKFSSSIGTYGKQYLRGPMGVTENSRNIYILDTANRRLVILTKTGALVSWVSITPQAGNAIPVGITVDPQQRIYISAIGEESQLLVYDKRGSFLYRFPEGASSAASITETPQKPAALYASRDQLFVTDLIDQDIKIFDFSGKLITKFGQPGSDYGQFLYANGITVDHDGYIYISDSNNSRIQVFNQKGRFLYQFAGNKADPLALPRGLALDNKGRLHVVDTLKHKVFVFTKKGQPLFTYGTFGNQAGMLSYPNSIMISESDGTIYIAEKQNNRISIWKQQ